VTLDCRLVSNAWDGIVVLSVTDLSNEGLWVETPYALAEGEELVVSFDMPDAEHGSVWAIAEVARVGMWRRHNDERASGMGLVFTYCSEDDRCRLRAALQGLPPPLPPHTLRMATPPPLPNASEGQRLAEVGEDDALPVVLEPMWASEAASDAWSLASE